MMSASRRSAVRRSGFTLVEVLIALAIISIAFASLSFVQLTNLRASTTSQLATEVKTAANLVLEDLLASVLEVDTNPGAGDHVDPTTGFAYRFNDYYWSCPTFTGTPPADRLAITPEFVTLLGTGVNPCSGQRSIGRVQVDFLIRGLSLDPVARRPGEGVVEIVVTASSADGGPALTIGDRVTCYDIFPSPTNDTPAPCPTPGEGR